MWECSSLVHTVTSATSSPKATATKQSFWRVWSCFSPSFFRICWKKSSQQKHQHTSSMHMACNLMKQKIVQQHAEGFYVRGGLRTTTKYQTYVIGSINHLQKTWTPSASAKPRFCVIFSRHWNCSSVRGQPSTIVSEDTKPRILWETFWNVPEEAEWPQRVESQFLGKFWSEKYTTEFWDERNRRS